MLSLKKFVKNIIKSIIKNLLINTNYNNKSIIRNEYNFIPSYSNSKSNKSRYRDFNFPANYYISPHYAYKFENVSLIGPYAIPVTSKGKIIGQTFGNTLFKCIRRTINELGLISFFLLYIRALLPFKKFDLDDGLHLVPRHGYGFNKPNYCHWMLENFPQLYCREYMPKSCKIIVNSRLTKWQLESFKLINLDENNLFKHSKKKMSHVKNLYFSTMRSASSLGSDRDPKGRLWVASTLGHKSNLKVTKKRKVFLSRQNMPRGHITNMSDLKALLDDFDIEIFNPGSISLKNDIDVFKNTEMIIAPHGAGMANMLFAKNCHVIEIVCGKKLYTDFFYMTALELDHTFETFFAEIDYTFTNEHIDIEEAWFVNTKKLRNIIKQSLSC